MKSEIKIEFSKTDLLKDLIQKAYFEEGYLGKLLTKNNYIEVSEDVDEESPFGVIGGDGGVSSNFLLLVEDEVK